MPGVEFDLVDEEEERLDGQPFAPGSENEAFSSGCVSYLLADAGAPSPD
jgi:hypothetical protein